MEAKTRRITVTVEVPEGLGEGLLEKLGDRKTVELAIRALIADMLAAEAGLTEEEARWLEREVKKELRRLHS